MVERTLKNPVPTTTLVPRIPTTDGELLMRFSRHGDEAAFAELVEKHGRLVWTVCWQVLRQHHEIEDAFQATFFILAKRARSIRSCDSLCGWLYRVAYRTALRSRMNIKRQPVSDLVADDVASPEDKLQAIELHEQRAVLLEELHTLPDRYQLPLVSCYLEGKSRRAIADELGCSLEAVKGRLARGRQLLRHRMIRRGVSLSLAMGAMTIPVKSATAAVTPKLVGLTVTGAGAWLVGATATAKLATTLSTSSQVIYLAHQGTVAMTIASFAKPAVVAVALLGAVSASMAVDSAEQGARGDGAQIIELADGAEVQITADGATTIENDDAVEIVMANEPSPDSPMAEPQPPDGALVVAEKARRAAPPRVPSPAYVPLPADVMVPDQPPMPGVPVIRPLNMTSDIHVTGPSLDIELKLAAHQTKIAQLQLESKELEIKAFDADEKKREELLMQSRKMMLMAEAEQLRLQVEQQQKRIEELERLTKEQQIHQKEFQKKMEKARKEAEKAGEVAKSAAEVAKVEATKAGEQAKKEAKKFAIASSRVVVDDARAMGKEARVIIAKQHEAHGGGQAYTVADDWAPAQWQSESLLRPGDSINIEAIGVLPDKPIDGPYTIEAAGGTVALGATYGRVKIAGMTVIEAEQAILRELKKTVEDPKVQVIFVSRGKKLPQLFKTVID